MGKETMQFGFANSRASILESRRLNKFRGALSSLRKIFKALNVINQELILESTGGDDVD